MGTRNEWALCAEKLDRLRRRVEQQAEAWEMDAMELEEVGTEASHTNATRIRGCAHALRSILEASR